MEDLGSTPSRSLDPMSSANGVGGGANTESASLIISFPSHGRDALSVNRSEDPLLIHHLPVERVDDEISSQRYYFPGSVGEAVVVVVVLHVVCCSGL